MMICKVQRVFQLHGRLVIVTDKLGAISELTHGGIVELRRPDGSVLTTKVWIEMPSPPIDDRPVSFSIEPGYKKSDIPVGTEVIIVRATRQIPGLI